MAKRSVSSRPEADEPDVTAPAAPSRPIRGSVEEQASRGPLVHTRPTTRTAAAAQAAADVDLGDGEFPKTMYRKTKPSAKYPNGYEARQVDEEAHAALDEKIWKDSPEGMTPDVPHGHEE